MKSTIRRCAEHMNRNSTFGVITLWKFDIAISTMNSCPLYNWVGVWVEGGGWGAGWWWSGVAKMSCILHHRGVQLILAYSCTRLAILVASNGKGECFHFLCFFPFIPVPLSSLSLSFMSSTISSISFLPFSERRDKITHKVWLVVKSQHNQSTAPKL